MMTVQYEFPIQGRMKNWESFSGDLSNPIRPAGLQEILNSLEEGSFESAMVDTYDMENGIVTVDITATEEAHKNIEIRMGNIRRKETVKRRRGDPEIQVSTSMKRLTRVRG